jgi:hypothetical protein
MAKRTSTRLIARIIEGAKPSQMPGFINPQLARLRSRPPSGDQWLHDLNKGRVTIFTRSGLDWTKRFPIIASAFDIPVERAIIDGEVVAIKDDRPNFSELQADLASGRQQRLTSFAFDLLYLEGFDLRRSPQIERKRVLKMLFEETRLEPPIVYSEHLVTDGQEMFDHACKLKWEGIISKNAEAPYRSDRNEGWIKIKCAQRAKFEGGWLRQRCRRNRCPLPRKTIGQRTELRRQGGDRLVPHRLRRLTQEAGRSGEPQVQTDKARPATQGHVGRAEVLHRSGIPKCEVDPGAGTRDRRS